MPCVKYLNSKGIDRLLCHKENNKPKNKIKPTIPSCTAIIKYSFCGLFIPKKPGSGGKLFMYSLRKLPTPVPKRGCFSISFKLFLEKLNRRPIELLSNCFCW